jgi:hypothetical protein
MLTILSKKLNAVLFRHVYTKLPSFTNNTHIASALLRFNKEKTPKKQKEFFNDSQLKEYIRDLNKWNICLANPVCVDDDFTQYTALDWVNLEKQILMAQLKECTHQFNPDGFVDMKKTLDKECTFIFSREWLQWTPASMVSIGSGIFFFLTYSRFLDSVFKGVESPMAKLAEVLGTATTFGVILGAFYVFSRLLDSSILRDVISNKLSNNWDSVLEEKSLSDAILVSLLCSFYKRASSAGSPIIDFRIGSPQEAFCMLVDSSSSTLIAQFKAITPIEEGVYESFKKDLYEPPIVPYHNLNSNELLSTTQELTVDTTAQPSSLTHKGLL